jgi:hypothetical protein
MHAISRSRRRGAPAAGRDDRAASGVRPRGSRRALMDLIALAVALAAFAAILVAIELLERV